MARKSDRRTPLPGNTVPARRELCPARELLHEKSIVQLRPETHPIRRFQHRKRHRQFQRKLSEAIADLPDLPFTGDRREVAIYPNQRTIISLNPLRHYYWRGFNFISPEIVNFLKASYRKTVLSPTQRQGNFDTKGIHFPITGISPHS